MIFHKRDDLSKNHTANGVRQMEEVLRKPIIIIGTGRCGSSMLFHLLGHHEDAGWLSAWNEILPIQQWLSILSRAYSVQWLTDRMARLPFFPTPFEAYRFWEYFLPMFSRRDKPFLPDDVLAEQVPLLRHACSRILRYQGSKRLVVKITGWSRCAAFNKIFPDALFVWIKRDHLSVIASLAQINWLDASSSPDSPQWQWGKVPQGYYELWKELGGGSYLSTALKMQLDIDDIRTNLALFPERSYQIQYETLIQRPEQTLRELLSFCDLPWTAEFHETVQHTAFFDNRDKWKRYINNDQAKQIMSFFERISR